MKDLNLRSAPVLAIAEGATTPAPASGERPLIWSSTLNLPMFWDGTRWRSMTAISVGTTSPSNPFTGQVWIDTN